MGTHHYAHLLPTPPPCFTKNIPKPTIPQLVLHLRIPISRNNLLRRQLHPRRYAFLCVKQSSFKLAIRSICYSLPFGFLFRVSHISCCLRCRFCKASLRFQIINKQSNFSEISRQAKQLIWNIKTSKATSLEYQDKQSNFSGISGQAKQLIWNIKTSEATSLEYQDKRSVPEILAKNSNTTNFKQV